jgi:hypothetical protein
VTLAHWLRLRLPRVDAKGQQWAPGGGYGRRWKQPDGSELAVVAQGDTFDVFIGGAQIYNVTLDARTAKELAWWLVRWWIFACWFGLKLKLWDWALARTLSQGAEHGKPPASDDLVRR